jgi:hypothetical protein
MKKILRVLAIINNNYDKTKEPQRFLLGIVFGLGPWFITDTLSIILDHTGLKILGFMWIIALVGLRMLWVTGNLKKYL